MHLKARAIGAYAIEIKFPVGTNIEEPAGGVIRTCYERVTVGEELNGVNVRLVTGKRLNGLASSNIPQLGKSVAGTRDEGVLVRWVQADAHDIAQVVGELHDLGACLNIPLHTSHISGRCENAPVIDEAAAGEIASMAGQLAGDTGGAIPVLVQVVNRADVVETTAGNVVSTRSIGASHDP